MGIMWWDLEGGFNTAPLVRNPHLTMRCEYPEDDLASTVVSFRLSPSYGLLTAREAHEWLLEMMREHEEFEVETDNPEELPVPFWSETVRRVVATSPDVSKISLVCGILLSSTLPNGEHPGQEDHHE